VLSISRRAARTLVVVALFNALIWLDFARRIAGDEGRETSFYVVHAVLIATSLVLAAIVGVIGWRALRRPAP
jgi:hypothetical protein